MEQTDITIDHNSSQRIDIANIIVSVRGINAGQAMVVIGSPGLPNKFEEMFTGDAVLFETPSDGILEVRAMSVSPVKVEFLISRISPRIGIMGGYVTGDPNNAPFTSSELAQVANSIEDIKRDLHSIPNVTSEQLDLIARKLDDVQAASGRLGRKDWILFVASTLTTTCVSLTLDTNVSKALFNIVNSAFTWLFSSPPLLLP